MWRRHGLLGLFYALIAIVAIAMATLIALGWLASIHPASAMVAFIVGFLVLSVLLLDRVLNAPSRFARLRFFAKEYEGLVSAGREVSERIGSFLREMGSVARIGLIVLGWAIIGLLVAIVFMLPGLVLGPDSPAVMLGMLGVWAFFAVLVIGPVVTVRWLGRR